MKRSILFSTIAVFSGLGIASPVIAAVTPAPANSAPPGSTSVSGNQPEAAKPATACLSDVRGLTAEMSKQGYWVGGSDYGYGYPIGAYGYGMMTGARPIGSGHGYEAARPGYEIRTLVASANILARLGKQQACEGALASAHTLYTRYASDLRGRGLTWEARPDWRQRAIAAAKPVTGNDVSVRYDQLLDADVVNPSNRSLGSVHDLVTDPQTGKIAYVIISRGGLFGIGASYTPVPWKDFKAASNGGLLVLDTSKTVLDAAPQGRDDQFTRAGQSDAESQKVDSYWTAHVKLVSE